MNFPETLVTLCKVISTAHEEGDSLCSFYIYYLVLSSYLVLMH